MAMTGVSRGEFFRELLALAMSGVGIEAAFGATSETAGREILVSVFLRGACDGLNLVPPISGDDRKIYEEARPNIQMPISAPKPEDALLKLDDRFGLHPGAKPLHELFLAKKLAIVHAAGLTSNSRSHFDAQAMMELGTPDKKTTRTGWLTRLASATRMNRARGDIPTIAIGTLVPTSFLNDPAASVMGNINQMNLGGNPKFQPAEMSALGSMYGGSDWLSGATQEALRTVSRLQASGEAKNEENAAEYGNNEIGNRLRTLAQLIKLKLGIRVATLDMGGWDTHRYQGQANEGRFAQNVKQLAQALFAFQKEMGEAPVTVVVMSEFGRRLKENANRGTDHGHGNVMLAMGNAVNGGKIYGRFPGLKTEKLYEGADLAVTTDYRQVLSEMLAARLKFRRISAVFPGFRPGPELGIFRG